MPRRIEHTRHWNTADTQEELVSRATTTTFELGGLTIRLADVPLFRDGTNGLDQAIRVRIDGDRDQPVSINSSAGGNLTLPADQSTGHLFIPEISAATSLTITSTHGPNTASTGFTVNPQRKFTIHLVHHSHFDYGYTDPQAMVLEHQLRYIDAALDLITATDDFAPDDQFRWNVEVTFPLRHWLANRPPAMRDELFRRVHEGRIEINGLPFSMHSEVYSIDELAWGLQFTDELREKDGVEIVSAVQSDVPGATLGLLNLLTSADIKYLSVAHNYAGRSIPHLLDGQQLTKPFWWQGADSKRLLVWMSDTPHGVAYMDGVIVGTSLGIDVTRRFLPDYLANLATKPYPYGKRAFGWHDLPPDFEVTKKPYKHDILALRVQNGFADNAPPTMILPETVQAWNAEYAYPKLRVSTNRDFFTEIENRLGDKIDTFTGDWTDWWVDGVGSAALPLGLNRQTQATVRTAQTLHTLAGNTTESTMARVDQVYEDAALFDEHTWGSANPWMDRAETFNSGDLQWGTKSAFAYTAFDNANELLSAGLHHLTAGWSTSPDALASLIVFNPSAYARWDLARVFIPLERLPLDTPATLIDARTGEPVPFRIAPQDNWGFRAKGQWIEFTANNLSAVGFARYDLIPAEQSANATEPADTYTLESPHYRVKINLASGFIDSISDLDSGREIVNTDAPFGFNEYIYDHYTTPGGFNHLSGRIQDVDMTLMGERSLASHAAVISRTRDALADQITLRLQATGTDGIETTISLPQGPKRIDISNRLFKQTVTDKESVYFAFPFAIDDSDPLYEITGGTTTQSAPHIPGSCRHMFAIRHWVGLQDSQGSAAWATMEAPLIELGTIALPYSPFPSTIPADRTSPATIYSWALNNMWDTNFPPSQRGEMVFRYAISSESDLPREALGQLTAATYSAPLVGQTLRTTTSGQQAPVSQSWATIDNASIELVTIRPGRDSATTLLLQSIANEPVTTSVDISAFNPTNATVGNHLGRNLVPLEIANGAVTLTIPPGHLITLNLTGRA